MEEADQHVPLEAERREVVRLGLGAAERRGDADDVALVDVLGGLGALIVGEPARPLHAEEHVEREVPTADAFVLGRQRGDRRRRDVAIRVLEERRDAVLVLVVDLEAVAVARREEVPRPVLGARLARSGGDPGGEHRAGDGRTGQNAPGQHAP